MYLDKVLIFDNFLPKNYFKEIKKHGHSIHYIFSQNYDNDVDSPMITSSIHIDHPNISKKIKKSTEISKIRHFIRPITYILEEKLGCELLWTRSRFNILFERDCKGVPHTDNEALAPGSNLVHPVGVAAILYLTNSDGNTTVYKEKLKVNNTTNINLQNLTVDRHIAPKENRLVVFSGDRYHSVANPITSTYRMVLNSNFLIKKEDEDA